jgi:predicted NACHT family NTPase
MTTYRATTSAVAPLNSSGQFEALYPIAAQWQPLKRRYIGLLEGVPLDSAEARQARENQRLMEQLARQKPPPIEPPPDQRVRDCLARFESGQLDAWWHLNFELTLSSQSTHYLVDHDFLITKMHGWLSADEETRNTIISAAERYLRNAEPLVSEWLGTGSYKYSDYAAYRALILLRQTRREVYDGLDHDLWRKWAPLVAPSTG